MWRRIFFVEPEYPYHNLLNTFEKSFCLPLYLEKVENEAKLSNMMVIGYHDVEFDPFEFFSEIWGWECILKIFTLQKWEIV